MLFQVEDLQKRDEKTSILVVGDATAVVTLARQVRQRVEWEVLIVVQEHLHSTSVTVRKCDWFKTLFIGVFSVSDLNNPQ